MRAGPLNDQMREALEEARTKMGLEKEHADKVIAGLATQQASSAVAVRCPAPRRAQDTAVQLPSSCTLHMHSHTCGSDMQPGCWHWMHWVCHQCSMEFRPRQACRLQEAHNLWRSAPRLAFLRAQAQLSLRLQVVGAGGAQGGHAGHEDAAGHEGAGHQLQGHHGHQHPPQRVPGRCAPCILLPSCVAELMLCT